MGYGFSLPDNPADHFSMGFSPTIATYINATKAQRSINSDGRLPESDYSLGQGTLGVTRNHWVRIEDGKPEFSPHFLEDFSIALENPRECRKAALCTEVTPDLDMDVCASRIQLHVFCAILMILQKGQLGIRKYDRELSGHPQNAKQIDAARYRNNQLDILDYAIDFLTGKLCPLYGENPKDGQNVRIIRLEDALANCPGKLLKDFRSILNTGMKTRDPKKIRERGGIDFAFTIWLCGLWILKRETPESGLEAYLLQWLRFLDESYPYPGNDFQALKEYSTAVQERDRAQWFDPVRNQADGADIADPTSTVATYMDAIQTTIGKHPQSTYNSPELDVKRLEWCYDIVTHEGVWFPNLADEEGDDEWILVLERAEENTG